MEEKKIFKYNEDDILEILTEHLALKFGFDEFYARALIIGVPGKNLRMVAVVGDSEDNSIKDIDLNTIDTSFEYNGSQSKASYINPANIANIKVDDF